MTVNLEIEGETLLDLIKNASWFPFKSGNLKNNATSGIVLNNDTYLIKFDSSIAPYLEALEEGSKPHDIPNAFGKDLPFGIGGRFDGKFHPGSYKHQGFIKNKSIYAIINYFVEKYNGEVIIND